MASADLGIRIVLQDSASPGFSALGINMGSLMGKLTALAMVWNQLTPAQQALSASVLGLDLAYQGFSGALQETLTAAGDLQASMIQVGINVAGANDDAARMQLTLTNLADYSVFSSQQVADGFVLMGQKGFTAADIIDKQLGKAMVDLAEATNSQTVPAATLLSAAMQAWHADASQSIYYANALSFAFHNGIPDISALQQAIMQAGAQAVDAKIPFKDFVLMLDELGKQGLSGAQAATSLRYMIASLLNPTAKAAEEMANLGVITLNNTTPALRALLDQTNALEKDPLRLTGTLKDLNELYTSALKVGTLHTDQSFLEWATGIGAVKNNLYDAKGNFQGLSAVIDVLGPKLAGLNTSQDFNMAIENLFNVRGGKGASALLNDLGFTTKQIHAMSAAYDQYIKQNGSIKAATETTSGWNAVQKELGSTLHSFSAQIGTMFLGPLEAAGTGLNNLLNSVRTGHPSILTFIGGFLLIGTVLSAVGLVIGIVIGAVMLFGTLLAPIAIVIGGIVAVSAELAGIFVLVKTHTAQLSPIMSAIGGIFKSVSGDFKGLGQVGNDIKPTLAQLGPLFNQLFSAISSIVSSGPGMLILGTFFFLLSSAIHTAIGVIVSVVSGGLRVIVGVLQFVVGVLQIVAGIFTLNGDLIGKGWDNLWHGLWRVVQGIGTAIGGIVRTIITGILATIQAMLEGLSHIPLIGGMFAGAAGGVKSLIDAMNGVSDATKTATALTQKQAEEQMKAAQSAVKSGMATVTAKKQEETQLLDELKHATTTQQSEAIRRRLELVRQAQSEAAESVKTATMKYDTLSKLDEQYRVKALSSAIQKRLGVVKENTTEINNAEAELKKGVDSSTKLYLEKKIKALQHANEEQLGAVSEAKKQRDGIVAHLTATKNSSDSTTKAMASQVEGNLRGMAGVVGQIALDLAGLWLKGMLILPEKMLELGGDLMSKLAAGITGSIGKVAQAFTSGIKNIPGLGGVISGSALGGIHIPGLANGGVVTGPTLAVVGEGREPEVVLPVSKLAAFMDGYKGAGGGGGGNIVVQVPIDGNVVAEVVVNRVTGQVRQLGGGRIFR